MRVIVAGRQTGKTHRLVEWVKQGNPTDTYPVWSRIIVTQSLAEADRLRNEYDLEYRQVFSWSEWATAIKVHPSPKIGLDNADMILSTLLGTDPVIVTMTGNSV